MQTPRILQVLGAAGCSITVEERLIGQPMRSDMDDAAHFVTDREIEALLAVLTALAGVRPVDDLGVLPVLEGEAPLSGDVRFELALADLVERRSRQNRRVLGARVGDLDRLVDATTTLLCERGSAVPALIHGDLIPANVLLEGARPASVLDFGFLTMVGDPRFDAAVTASIYDMYGARARANEAAIDEAVVDRFGCSVEDLGLYRAAYALVTSNCFTASGSDGHFAWCTAMLERTDVRESIAL